MGRFIINEWFWADLSGENGDSARRESFGFLEGFKERADQIVVLERSAFDVKAWKFCKQTDVIQRPMARYFVALRQDPARFLLLKPADVVVAMPAEFHDVKEDDHYLVRCFLARPDSVIVTTDGPLIEILRRCGVACEHRDQFLARYSR